MKITDARENGPQTTIELRPQVGRVLVMLGGGLLIAATLLTAFPTFFSWNLVGLTLFIAVVYGAMHYALVQGGYSSKRVAVDRNRRTLLFEWVQWLRGGTRSIALKDLQEVCCNDNVGVENQTWDVCLHLKDPATAPIIIDWTATRTDALELAQTLARASGVRFVEHEH